jgi:hypothetical protein
MPSKFDRRVVKFNIANVTKDVIVGSLYNFSKLEYDEHKFTQNVPTSPRSTSARFGAARTRAAK